MSRVTVLNGQSVLDITVQEYGSIEGVILLAFANDLSVTEDLEVGTELVLPELEINETVAGHFLVREEKPSTMVTEADDAILENNDPCNLCNCF